jgi:bifunctional non-homologous end joining protein LigD
MLETYQSMRDFKATPEPKGRKRKSAGALGFVIQKHAARRLHYDLRLELEGVLKSWAVTRGPSLVPGEKRLSVHVEDHPMDYGDFEGTIPEGQYGAGTVIVWDRGTWTPVFDPHKGYAKGHLEFELKGEKLTGRWHLIRMRGKPREKRENWLLIKGEDASARDPSDPDILELSPQSVKSGRTIEDLAGKPARKTATRKTATRKTAAQGKAKAMPGFLPPMLASLVKTTPGDDRWLHEIKFDGYRIQAHVQGGKARLFTRSGRDWTDRFGPALADALRALPVNQAVLDGEVVVETGGRTSDFSALQADLAEGRTDRMTYYAFDLLHLDGRDLTPMPLVERKRLLVDALNSAKGPIRLSEHLSDQGAIVLRHACRMGLEGIISKLRDSHYRSGRSNSWVKSKCSARQEFVIGGFVPSTASPRAIGSLVMGVYDGDRLRSVGRVGTGFSVAVAEDLYSRLTALETAQSPFDPPLKGQAKRGVRHVSPDLVAEVDFRAWTDDGNLRHAAFRGLREDKDPHDVTGEGLSAPPSAPKDGIPPPAPPVRRIKLTNPDRVYWPDEGITKADLADYYAEVWAWIAPHVTGRPLALLRCPNGINGQKFFQKHDWKGMNAAILRVKDPSDPKDAPSIAIADFDGLTALAQAASLEIHPWGSTLADWERPDRIVIDLDPGDGVGWNGLTFAAQEVRQRLENAGLAAFVKTSGGKGLHVVAPLVPKAEWPAVKTFCRQFARSMAGDDPARYVATITKSKRQGKILIDYLRNQRGATAVAAYSTRARPGGLVSAPVSWDELDRGLSPADFTIRTMPARLAALRRDPWSDFAASGRPLPG